MKSTAHISSITSTSSMIISIRKQIWKQTQAIVSKNLSFENSKKCLSTQLCLSAQKNETNMKKNINSEYEKECFAP